MQKQYTRHNTHDLLYGTHAIQAILTIKPHAVRALFVLPNRHTTLIQQARNHGIEVHICDKHALYIQTDTTEHQGIAAHTDCFMPFDEHDCKNTLRTCTKGVFVLCDGVEDPRNIGAILRVCDTFGARGLILAKHKSPPLGAVVAKAASGARESVPLFRVANIARTLQTAKQYGAWVYGLDAKGTMSLPAAAAAYTDNVTVLVAGSEGSGLSKRTRDCCDGHIAIPMTGRVSSLNVSVSVAIALYAFGIGT